MSRLLLAAVAGPVTAVLAPASPAAAHTGDPAGGAPLEDLVPASIVAAIAVAGLAVLAVAYRKGGATALRRLAAFSERVSGLPRWGALPAAVGGGALVIAVFGFYWDVSTHIDNGRDAGPFANPSHFFILAGLAGITLAGYLAVLIGTPGPTASSVRLIRLHRDRSLQALPIYLPEDPAIPAEEVPAENTFTRPFVPDKELLQREAVGGSPTLQAIGYAILLVSAAAWLGTAAWALRRIDRAVTTTASTTQAARQTADGLSRDRA